MKHLSLFLVLLFACSFSINAQTVLTGDYTITGQLQVQYDVFIPTGQSYWIGSNTDSGNRLRLHQSGSATYIDFSPHLNFRRGDLQIVLQITDMGNVGIGTSNPQNKLDVNGTIRAKEIKVETGWADYVFADSYQLPSLMEVKRHIFENKHLPGIPTEAEVKENGVNLGEMQAKLLQKIEELTLYTIQQQEMIDKLSAKIEKLENEK